MTLHYRSVCRAVTMVGLCTALATAGGCGLHQKIKESTPVNSSGGLGVDIPKGFDFKTSDVKVININRYSDNYKSGKALVYFIFQNKRCVISRGYADEEGEYRNEFDIPSYVDTLYVEIAGNDGATLLTTMDLKTGTQKVEVIPPAVQSVFRVKGSDGWQTGDFFPYETGYGTLMFEDNWPEQGDYDFNDLVFNYHLSYSSKMMQVKVNNILRSRTIYDKFTYDYYLSAAGAAYHSGFAIKLPASLRSKIVSATVMRNDVLPAETLTIDKSSSAPIVIPVFNDQRDYVAAMWNTAENTTEPPVHFSVELTFRDLPEQSYDYYVNSTYKPEPYILRKKDNVISEIHLPGKVFDQDGTDLYTTSNTEPWALDVSFGIRYPYEYINIKNAFFPYFSKWFTNTPDDNYTDWFVNPDIDSTHPFYMIN